MQRGRTLILLGILLVVAVAAAALILGRTPPPPTTTPGPPSPTPITVVKIVAAFQPIPLGSQIKEGSGQVGLLEWPADKLPPKSYTDVSKVVGKYAKIGVAQGMPILEGMLSETTVPAAGGSDAALAIPPGQVGVVFPFRSTYPEKENLPYDRRDKEVLQRLLSVAYAIKPGDRVDAIACLWVYEIDKEFQSRLPNKLGYIDPANPGKPVEGMAGRAAVSPGGQPAVEGPSEPQLPRMVCQWIGLNALVVGLGDWTTLPPTPQAQPTPAGGGGGAQPTPTPLPPLPQYATLAVKPQDALVLKYARETGAQIDLVLRSAVDQDAMFSTEAVTLQYLFERFKVAVPPKLEYGIGGGGGVPVGGGGK